MPVDADLLLRLLSTPDSAAARKFIAAAKPCSKAQRKELAQLAGLEAAWVACDQAVPGNIEDMADSIVAELYEPFWFFRRCLSVSKDAQQPGRLFARGRTTRPLQQQKGFWTARAGLAPCEWLPERTASFDAVCHVVQAASGTGIHVGDGRILTCAHVVDYRDDAALEEEGKLPKRLGRLKLLMFASGRTFFAECVAVKESVDGASDVAVLMLRDELPAASLPHPPPAEDGAAAALPPAARLASAPAELGERLFCVGNPSNVDLEAFRGKKASIAFDPPAWHTSVGLCKGYQSTEIYAAREAQAARGRAPTRGERKLVDEAQPVGADLGVSHVHSCWTYWGHSGAPLFTERGEVCGLHSSWDHQNGARHAQMLACLQSAIEAAEAKATAEGGSGGKAKWPSAAGDATAGKGKASAPAARGDKGKKRAAVDEQDDAPSAADAGKATAAPAAKTDVEDEDDEEAPLAPLAQRMQARLAEERKRAKA